MDEAIKGNNQSSSTPSFSFLVISSSSSFDQPFFLFLSFQAVHAPLEVPPEWISICPSHLPTNRRLYCGFPSPSLLNSQNVNIEGLLAGMDKAIGKLMAHLREIGQFERTLIVFGTDVRAN